MAENLQIKQQLLILSRTRQRAPNLTPRDRILLGFFCLFLRPTRIHKVAAALRPATLLGFHQCLVRRKYQPLFSSSRAGKPGPKGPSEELIRAVVQLKSRNPRFGCPRIALIIAKTFGLEIDKDVVCRILVRHYRPFPGGEGPSWLTFIGHPKDSLWRCDKKSLLRVVPPFGGNHLFHQVSLPV